MTDPFDGRPRGRARTNVWGLLLAALFLLVATVGLTGQTWWLIGHNLPWVIAAAAAVVGVGLVVSSLPHRRHH